MEASVARVMAPVMDFKVVRFEALVPRASDVYTMPLNISAYGRLSDKAWLASALAPANFRPTANAVSGGSAVQLGTGVGTGTTTALALSVRDIESDLDKLYGSRAGDDLASMPIKKPHPLLRAVLHHFQKQGADSVLLFLVWTCLS